MPKKSMMPLVISILGPPGGSNEEGTGRRAVRQDTFTRCADVMVRAGIPEAEIRNLLQGIVDCESDYESELLQRIGIDEEAES